MNVDAPREPSPNLSQSPDDGLLVSVILVSYNQEKFIAEAVHAALSQTLRPLEIVLSDDASLDRTFEIMQEIASAYSGPHKLILNRNATNLGISLHVQHAVGLSRGRLLVGMAGDDRSAPERCEALLAAWAARGRPSAVLHSRLQAMNAAGVEQATPLSLSGNYFLQGQPLYRIINSASGINGCTGAWTRDLFENFGPLTEPRALEDTVLPARAILLGGEVIFVDSTLVDYRLDVSTWIGAVGQETSTSQLMFRICRLAECHRDSLKQVRQDFFTEVLTTNLPPELLRHISYYDSIVQLSRNPGFVSVLLYWKRNRLSLSARTFFSSLRFMFPRTYRTYWRMTRK